MKTILFVRFKNTKVGGAENYLTLLRNTLHQKTQVFSSGDYGQDSQFKLTPPKFLPSFLRFIIFLRAYESLYQKNPNYLYFSLERVLHCDIYRAGDGIHRQWLSIKNHNFIQKIKSYFNPMNILYIYIEKRLFKNTKLIIANSDGSAIGGTPISVSRALRLRLWRYALCWTGIILPNRIFLWIFHF